MSGGIAIVGMACRYPDAASPAELWQNALAGRRAFRRIPAERLRLEDYHAADRAAPDRTYVTQAAVLTDYAFPRERFRIAASTVRSTDLTQWLALDVASAALADAGYPDAEGTPRDTAAVVVGNSLAGEFSRAGMLRLRWPYVRRVTDAALEEAGWEPARRAEWLAALEARYKAPFPAVDADTLAGGLSNTIAGRVCNQFDLHGGGYTVDGACASSLLAVITGCTALLTGDADLVLAGGVDLSLDPFELVGFAKAGALADDAMRVYDARAAGFWPGEGCGFVVLMRETDARAADRRVHAVIRGWGVSSDGGGGITRPTERGQRLAVDRTYRRAPYAADAVGYFEGHGTGTTVGDATELRVLSAARSAALAARDGHPRDGARSFPGRAAVGSVKAIIGHTKAAAGVAGLIKATLAARERLIPPAVAVDVPHPELGREDAVLSAPREPVPWPEDVPARAAVSAMGFGGINTHVTLEAGDADTPRPRSLSARERLLAGSPQSCELLVLGADDAEALVRRAEALAERVAAASLAELGDLGAALAEELERGGRRVARAAVVARTPAEAAARLGAVASALRRGERTRVDPAAGVYLGRGDTAPRLGLLCSGQGGPVPRAFGFLGRRFPDVEQTPGAWIPPTGAGPVDTEVAQPNVVRAALAALRALSLLGLEATAAVGHSLGELVALHWAGALDAGAVWRVARARGRAMARCDAVPGAMAGLSAGVAEVERLIEGTGLVVAGLNGPRQTVVSGAAAAVDALLAGAAARGVAARRLAVSHAFHSPLVAPAAAALDRALLGERLGQLARRVASTVTGKVLPATTDVRRLLVEQVTAPVRFADAIAAVDEEVDLWIEAGPGDVLCGLARTLTATPALPMQADSFDAAGVCGVVAAAFSQGAPVDVAALFRHRFVRPADVARTPTVLANPCERAPVARAAGGEAPLLRDASASPAPAPVPLPLAETRSPAPPADGGDALLVVRRLTAERADLPLHSVRAADRLLADLHLSSISVGEIVTAAARELGLSPSAVPMDYASATVGEVAETLAALRGAPDAPPNNSAAERFPPGVAPWVRTFAPVLVERARPPARAPVGEGGWTVIAPPGHALAVALRECLAGEPGGGTIVCLPSQPDPAGVETVPLLLAGAHDSASRVGPLVFVHDGSAAGVGGFARSAHLERARDATCVVVVAPELAETNLTAAAGAVRDEARAARGFAEVVRDAGGRRLVAMLRVHAHARVDDAELRALLGPEDLVLVTGGGKGIAAECALDVARATGARLLLLGRADPAADPSLAATLDRMRRAGVAAHYRSADVTDDRAVREAIAAARDALGPVTAVLHGAGVNEPTPLALLDEAAVDRTVGPKLRGARNVLAAVDPTRLRAWVSFGSVIGRAGLPGEAHYAYANAALARFTEDLQRRLPGCRCRCVEWSVWAGVGMGERLHRVEALTRQGITPIGVDQGVAALRRVLADAACPTTVVVAGRLGGVPTVAFDAEPLPLLRFLERPRVWYPGVELVADVELTRAADPYLDDHVYGGERLLPAVIALEAIAQVTWALTRGPGAPAARTAVRVTGLELSRPIVVPADGSVTARVAALAHEDGRVDVVVRSSGTGFAADHVRATCQVGAAAAAADADADAERDEARPELGIDAAPVYEALLFQRGRFRRLLGYEALRATACSARVAGGTAGADPGWFGEYLPPTLLLGDPGARDACLHAVQACVPHARLLPVGADHIELLRPRDPERVRAREVARDGPVFTYDLDVLAADGTPCERWRGVRFRIAAGSGPPPRWPPALLGPYLERRVAELVPGTSPCAAVGEGETRGEARASALARLGVAGAVERRGDGRPLAPDPATRLSLAHAGARAAGTRLTLAVAGPDAVGCDVEAVTDRSLTEWEGLVGERGVMLAAALRREVGDPSGEEPACAATRVWAAGEALRKVGLPAESLVLERVADGWAVMRAGDVVVTSVRVAVAGADAPLVVAVATVPSRRPSGAPWRAGAADTPRPVGVAR